MNDNLENWILDGNFNTLYNFGDHQLNFTDDELLQAKQILKRSKSWLDKLDADNRICLFEALAAYIHNLKDEYKIRENLKPLKRGQTIATYDFGTTEDQVTIQRGSKKKNPPRVKKGLDPIITEAAKALSKSLNMYQHKNKKIPELAEKVAYQVDHFLKKLMPGITTDSIITKVYKEIGFPSSYHNIKHVNLRIKRGRKASEKI